MEITKDGQVILQTNRDLTKKMGVKSYFPTKDEVFDFSNLSNKRGKDESFKSYRARLKVNKENVERYLRGRLESFESYRTRLQGQVE